MTEMRCSVVFDRGPHRKPRLLRCEKQTGHSGVHAGHLAATPSEPEPPALDAAWAVIEDALPEGWAIAQVEHYEGEFDVAAYIPVNRGVGWRRGRAPTFEEAFALLLARIAPEGEPT